MPFKNGHSHNKLSNSKLKRKVMHIKTFWQPSQNEHWPRQENQVGGLSVLGWPESFSHSPSWEVNRIGASRNNKGALVYEKGCQLSCFYETDKWPKGSKGLGLRTTAIPDLCKLPATRIEIIPKHICRCQKFWEM